MRPGRETERAPPLTSTEQLGGSVLAATRILHTMTADENYHQSRNFLRYEEQCRGECGEGRGSGGAGHGGTPFSIHGELIWGIGRSCKARPPLMADGSCQFRLYYGGAGGWNT